MILLDTHVLSEFMRPAPAAQAVAWLNAQAPEQVWVCAVTRAEIELGVSLLPDGQRKLGLHLAATAMFTEEFAGRCLPFDEQVASLTRASWLRVPGAGARSVLKMRRSRPSHGCMA